MHGDRATQVSDLITLGGGRKKKVQNASDDNNNNKRVQARIEECGFGFKHLCCQKSTLEGQEEQCLSSARWVEASDDAPSGGAPW